ncbi:MAG: hypothetical protein JNL57_12815 [Bacteroidetes bacterium]|nr:hypothetical protein [Bacteroidota bacterium]
MSRAQRMPEALSPEAVEIDGRKAEDLIAFLQAFGKELQFWGYQDLGNNEYALEQDPAKTMDLFLQSVETDDEGYTEPLIGMIHLFLELYEIARTDLNSLSKKHLEFYYRDILGIEQRGAEENHVYLLLEVAKQVEAALLEKGILFKTGQKQNGEDVLYELSSDFSFSKAAISELKNVLYDLSGTGLVYASEIANSEDGQGAELAKPEAGWQTFGSNNRNRPDLGFAIASPLFRMAEGTRKITLTLAYSAPDSVDLTALDYNAYRVEVSGEKGWIAADIEDEKAVTITNSTIAFVFTIPASEPAFIPPTEKLHGQALSADYPVVRVLLDHSTENALFEMHSQVSVLSVTINTDCKGVKNLLLQNDYGLLDASKPVEPFTNQPALGSKFYIGSQEVFQKKLDSLTLHFDWKKIPTEDFGEWYKLYKPSKSRENTSFKATVDWLQGKSFIPGSVTTINLMGSSDSATINSPSLSLGASPSGVDADPELGGLSPWNHQTDRGYVRLTLSGADFGHADFQSSYTIALVNAVKDTSVTDVTSKLPQEPYTPLFENCALDYTASATMNCSFNSLEEATADSETAQHHFIHLGPFGFAASHYATQGAEPTMIFNPGASGELLLGIDSVVALSNLSLLFVVADGTADPDLPAEKVFWHYLHNNQWVEFGSDALLREQTSGLLNTGIVTLTIPSDPDSENTWLPSGKFWIRASVTGKTDAVCDLLAIHTQAAEADLLTTGVVKPDGLALAAGTIGKMQVHNSQFKKISQPYGSFGGKAAETETEWYTRVSERQRHKDRAITGWDYERLALQEFTDLYKAKMLNHTLYNGNVNGYRAMAPGNCTLVVVSNVQNQNAANPLQPKTSKARLLEIKDFLNARNSSWATLQVTNPIYEEIQIETNVRFMAGEDVGLCKIQLEEDIKAILCPWAYGSETEIVFGGRIHRSTLMYEIEKLDYVDYLTCFRMYQIRPAGLENHPEKDVEVAECATAASILVSAGSHVLHEITGDDDCDCDCDDNEVTSTSYVPAKDCGCP